MVFKQVDYEYNQELNDIYATESAYSRGSVTTLNRWESFKASFQKAYYEEPDRTLSDMERAIIATSRVPLMRRLQGRHLTMIAIGGSIGTGLFIGSGAALKSGGPAALIFGFFIVGAMIFCTTHALGELAVAFPTVGGASSFSTRFLDPAWGFAMGWNYAICWMVVLPLELVVATIIVQYWNDQINSAVFALIFYLFVVIVNLFGVRGYGETEFVFSTFKLIAITVFIIMGLVLICGGGPKGGYIGAKYWHNPGPLSHGFKGICTVFVTASFSFGGTEIVGLAAAETENPQIELPRATRQVFWRIIIFYLITLTIICFLVPYNNTSLGSGSYDPKASPFIIATTRAGIEGIGTFLNLVILISVISVANSSVFACSRTLAALSLQDQAPKFLSYVDVRGRPLGALAVNLGFGLLCFTATSDNATNIFNWLAAIAGLSFIFTWGSICAAHLRFRYALKINGRGTDELVFISQTGIIGSTFGLLVNFLILIAQFWIGLYPIGSKKPNVVSFMQAYMAFFVVFIFWLGYKIWKKQWSIWVRAYDIDIDIGRKEHDLDLLKQEILDEKEYIASRPFYYRFYRSWC